MNTAKTPLLSPEELRQAICALATDDVPRRFAIGETILRQGMRGVPELLGAMTSETPEIRRAVVYLLGELAKGLVTAGKCVPEAMAEALQRSVLDDDAKVRRNGAIALGALHSGASVSVLSDALARETVAWVRPSLLLALGAIGGEDVATVLSAYLPTDDAARAALDKALDRATGSQAHWRMRTQLSEPITVQLATLPGLEAVVAAEVRERLSLPVDQVMHGRVQLCTDDLYRLFTLRTFTELLLPLATAPLRAAYGEADILQSVAEMLERDGVLARILALHEDEPCRMRYRLEIQGKLVTHAMRRTLITGIVARIAQASPRFVNSPSHYNIELRVTVAENELALILQPRTVPDARFAYRVHDVPASINPVAAAGIVRLAPRLFPHGRVLDPFCGSGTMLIERGFAGAYQELVGVDIAQAAVDAAEANAKATGLEQISIRHGDMREIPGDAPFHEIISNMPFGLRTGTHESNIRLYEDFFARLPQWLVKGGLLLLFTQEIRLTTQLLRKSRQLQMTGTHRIQSGGLTPVLFVATRK